MFACLPAHAFSQSERVCQFRPVRRAGNDAAASCLGNTTSFLWPSSIQVDQGTAPDSRCAVGGFSGKPYCGGGLLSGRLQVLASAGHDDTVRIWALNGDAESDEWRGREVSEDGPAVATASDGKLQVAPHLVINTAVLACRVSSIFAGGGTITCSHPYLLHISTGCAMQDAVKAVASTVAPVLHSDSDSDAPQKKRKKAQKGAHRIQRRGEIAASKAAFFSDLL